MLCNLECPVGLSQREICNLDGPPKTIVELRGVYEFSSPKVAQIGPSRC